MFEIKKNREMMKQKIGDSALSFVKMCDLRDSKLVGVSQVPQKISVDCSQIDLKLFIIECSLLDVE